MAVQDAFEKARIRARQGAFTEADIRFSPGTTYKEAYAQLLCWVATQPTMFSKVGLMILMIVNAMDENLVDDLFEYMSRYYLEKGKVIA